MNIIIDKSKLAIIKESIEVQNINLSDFEGEIKDFLFNFLSNNKTDNNFWKLNGLRNSDVVRRLYKCGILNDNNGKPRVPKKNFDRKVSRLYYELFPDGDESTITEDDGGYGVLLVLDL